jgi:CheY-like chemotaxis protein
MIGIHSDIDDFKNIQHELIKAKEEADHANQTKSHFLSSMSHELRTPLNSILGFSQLLKLELDSSDIENDCVDEILRSGRYLLDLINDILDLSKIESGRLSLSIEPVDLKQVVIDSLSVVKPLAQDRVNIEFNCDAEVIVRADITRLRQSIINLLSNAIKYNKNNGWVFITIDSEGDNILLNIKDTGVGISERNLRKVFEPFDRLNHESSGIEGTGIGLSITKRLMEMMDGNVAVESILGKGSVFTLSLPKAAQFIDGYEESTADMGLMTTDLIDNKFVLYIDDNPSNLRLVRNILKRLNGFEIIDAHSPEIGIELAKQEYPDVIVLDINMPNMNGYEVLRVLKADQILKYTPVIALTANAMPKDIKRGLEAGFDDYITKPLDIDGFVKSLTSLVK